MRQEMDTSNWRPSQGGGDSSMQFYDWRSQMTPDSRQRIVNKMYVFNLLFFCALKFGYESYFDYNDGNF